MGSQQYSVVAALNMPGRAGADDAVQSGVLNKGRPGTPMVSGGLQTQARESSRGRWLGVACVD